MHFLFPILAFVAPADDAGRVFAAATRAHSHLGAIHVRAVITAASGGPKRTTTYTITTDAKNALVRIQEPQVQGRGRSDRSFLFRPNDVLAYDAVANERIQRNTPFTSNFSDRAVYTIGQLDDLLRLMLDGSQVGDYLAQFADLGQWKVSKTASTVLLKRDVAVPMGRNVSEFRFDAKQMRLASLSLRSPEGSQSWSLTYLPSARPSLSIPKSARTVAAFTISAEPPRFHDKGAERAVRAMYDAYGKFTRGTLLVQQGSRKSLIQVDGQKLAETNPQLEYAYDGRTLTILRPSNREFYRAPVRRSSVPDVLATFGDVVEPFARQMLRGRVPIREILGSEFKVTTSGQVKNRVGVECDVLSAVSVRNQITLMIRRDNHLLDAVTSTVLDDRGASIGTTAKRYKYLGLGRPIPADQFVLKAPAGYQTKPMPEVKKPKLR